MLRTQIITFLLQSVVPPMFLNTVNSNTIHWLPNCPLYLRTAHIHLFSSFLKSPLWLWSSSFLPSSIIISRLIPASLHLNPEHHFVSQVD